MKKTALMLACGMIFNLAGAQQKTDKQLATEFDKILNAEFKPNEPGVTVLVSRKGDIVYKKAFGMANLELNIPMKIDNVFRIGSITKQFTAVAILQLMEQGKLSLQDEITKFIPDYPTQGNKITIEHLLTHTSGIQSFTSMKDYNQRMTVDMEPEEMINHFKNEPMEFTPGTKWNYNNSGYFLLGYIIEKASGRTYAQYIEENIFQPLGMTNSLYGSNLKIIKNRVDGYMKDANGYLNATHVSMLQPYAAGSIMSTVEDMHKWNKAVHANKLLKKENLAKALTSYKLTDSTSTGYGYGWSFGYVKGSPTIEHGGGINGSLTMGIYLPKEDVYVIIFSNCECYSPGEMAAKLASLAIGKPYEHKTIKLENAVLQEYPGVYENKKGDLRIITIEDNQLYSQRGRNQKFKIQPFEKDKFFFEEETFLTIEFSRNAEGKIEKLTTSGRQPDEVWIKTDKTLPTITEVKVDETILDTYVGEYEINADFTFTITRVESHMFLQATGQEKVEIFAEKENKFFLKVNDAVLEFIKDDTGKVVKAILTQSGRSTDAKKIK